jgi:uncharacterized protein (DUF3820 family)
MFPIMSFNPELAKQDLLKIAQYRMPYGKYAGRLLVELPEPYVVWLYNKGLPAGELGKMLGLLYEIKVNGLESLFTPIIKQQNKASSER